MSLLPSALLVLQAIQGPRLQSGVLVRPDTVTIGEPFTVVVTVRAPRGWVIELPQTPDSGAAVEPIDPVQSVPSPDSTTTEVTGTYRVAAWDIGDQPIPFPDVLARDGDQTRRVRLSDVTVFVRSILPADTTQRVPKPARDVITFGLPWWIWLIAALVVAALLWLTYWLWKRRRRRPPGVEDPLAVAEREFDRVEALGLVAAGERARHVVLMIEILRDYLARVVPAAAPALTTSELLTTLRGKGSVPTQRLAALLTEVDLVKFARRPVGAERATAVGKEARAICAVVRQLASGTPTARAA